MKTTLIVVLVFVTVACFLAAGIIAFTTNIFHDSFNLNFINGEAKNMNVNMNKTMDMNGVEKVKVYMQVGNVVLHPSDNAQAALTGFVIGSTDRIKFDVEKNGTELDVTVKQINGIFNFSIGELALDVGLPAGFNGTLEVNGATSKVNVGNFSLNTLKSKLTTGEIEVNALAKNIELESTTGSINLNGQDRSYENISMHSTTGSIHANKLRLKKMDCRSTTGKISLSDIYSEQTTAEATTGKIELLNCEGAVDARAMTGSIEASINNVQASYYETTTGKVSLTLPQNAAFNLDARSTTGRINTSFRFMGEMTGEKKFSAGAEIKGQTNNGGPEIKIRTTTGSIDINGK